jgi:hypothetical protein
MSKSDYYQLMIIMSLSLFLPFRCLLHREHSSDLYKGHIVHRVLGISPPKTGWAASNSCKVYETFDFRVALNCCSQRKTPLLC